MDGKKETSTSWLLPPVKEEADEEREKSLYLSQIENLTKELKRYKLRSQELKSEINDINDEIVAVERDVEDQKYLQHTLPELSKEKKKPIEQLEKEKAETQKLEAQNLQSRQENQELERRRDEPKAVTTLQVTKVEEKKLKFEQLSVKQTEAHEQMNSLKLQYEKAKRNVMLEKDNVTQRKQELNAITKLKHSALKQEETAQKEETHEKAVLLIDNVSDLKVDKVDLQSTIATVGPEIEKARATLSKDNQVVLVFKKEKERVTKMVQQARAKCVNKAEVLAQKQAAVAAERRLKQQQYESARSHLEARLQRARRWRKTQTEADIKKAVALLRTIVIEPQKEKQIQLMLKMQKVLESPGPQETGSRDQPQTSSTEASADPEALEKQVLLQMAQIRPGDLGLVPRPRWNIKGAHTPTRVGLPQIREPPHRRVVPPSMMREPTCHEVVPHSTREPPSHRLISPSMMREPLWRTAHAKWAKLVKDS